MDRKIKVLIVDDSELIRALLAEILAADPAIDVVATAEDAFDARDKIKQFNPDVITLDIEMPRMDGITFLSNIMRLRPMPVIMISSLTQKGADATLQALSHGAFDFVPKPQTDDADLAQLGSEIIAKIKSATRANPNNLTRHCDPSSPIKLVEPCRSKTLDEGIKLIAIGASTGGTEATRLVLSSLPSKMPPIVIVQHMPAGFTRSYADRLDKVLPFTVLELPENGAALQHDHVYIAHGDAHMVIHRESGRHHARRDYGAAVNRHRPSVDVLFDSVASCCGAGAIGVLLTGMGIDGAKGLGKMRAKDAMTIAQDEKSSIVWGMPREAVQQDAARQVLPLEDIGAFLVERCYH